MQLLNASPHVLRLLDVAALSHDRLGLVFPRYGQTLRDFALERQAGCQAGELERAFELEELAHFALCLACGLEHAHAHVLTHADVKPDNVLVIGKGNVASEDFAEALRNIPLRVVIAEFGLAQHADPEQRVSPAWRTWKQTACSFALYITMRQNYA